jgi:alkyl sulfatase BDS1-like metallo-beta-lactamase superfamily hydrolase
VRGIYSGELGWFNADPANLNPLPPKERARRYVELAGGSDAMLDKLRDAVEQEDWRWAADMGTWLIRAEPELQEAKQLKAHALRQMGYETINAPWRNFYLEGALELEGKIPSEPWYTPPSSQVMRNLPVQNSLLNFTTYLDARKALHAHVTVGFEFPDTGERYAIEIRRGVAELHDRKLPEHVPAWIRMDTDTFYELIARELSPRELAELVLAGKLSVQGDVGPLGEIGLVATFLSHFTPPSLNTPALVDR